jgi:hypothetical protein
MIISQKSSFDFIIEVFLNYKKLPKLKLLFIDN